MVRPPITLNYAPKSARGWRSKRWLALGTFFALAAGITNFFWNRPTPPDLRYDTGPNLIVPEDAEW